MIDTDLPYRQYLEEPRDVRIARWQQQSELCRRVGRTDLVAICQREIATLTYGGEPTLSSLLVKDNNAGVDLC